VYEVSVIRRFTPPVTAQCFLTTNISGGKQFKYWCQREKSYGWCI